MSGVEDRLHKCGSCGGLIISDSIRGEAVCEECGLVARDGIVSAEPTPQSGPDAPVCHPSNAEIPEDAFELDNCFGYARMDNMGAKLGLPQDALDMAKLYFRRGYTRLVRVKPGDISENTEKLAEASIALVCRTKKECLRPWKGTKGLADNCDSSIDELGELSYALAGVINLEDKIFDPAPKDYVSLFISELDLPTQVETKTSEVLQDLEENHFELYNSGESEIMTGGAIYFAARLECYPRYLTDIAEISGANAQAIGQTCRQIETALGIEVGRGTMIYPNWRCAQRWRGVDPEEMLRTGLEELERPDKVLEAVELQAELERRGAFPDVESRRMCAAISYIVCNPPGPDQLSQRLISHTYGVTESRISTLYREIVAIEDLNLEVEHKFTKK